MTRVSLASSPSSTPTSSSERSSPTSSWEFRNAAHHSGTANQFVEHTRDTSLPFFAAKGLPSSFVCDGSILRAAGIANSGLTLVALSYRLAELMRTLA